MHRGHRRLLPRGAVPAQLPVPTRLTKTRKGRIMTLTHLTDETPLDGTFCGSTAQALGLAAAVDIDCFASLPREHRCQGCESAFMTAMVQVSEDRTTCWVHALDGSTVGRFSMSFGFDVHTTSEEQMQGASQCLYCTHVAPTREDWIQFCALMQEHYGVSVDPGLMAFDCGNAQIESHTS